MKVGTLLSTVIHTYLIYPDNVKNVQVPKGELLLYLMLGDKSIHGQWYVVMTRDGVIGSLTSRTLKEVV